MSTLGKYELLEKIGEGGFGVVYKARDPLLDRLVAIKILNTDLARASDFIERFRREARLAAALRHPNIVSIIEVGEQDGRYFIVMEYLEGKPLAEILQEGKPLPLSQVVDLLRPLAEALDFAHAKGIIHRDVKPGNVILADGGRRPVLTDFGLVKSTTEIGTTTTGAVMGTPEYMSPEQITGKGLTPAVDQYALGVLAYQMLTGRVPFTGNTPFEVQNGHVNQPLPDPKQINPLLPESLSGVMQKALSKLPQERFSSCAAFLTILVQIAKEEGEKLVEKQYHLAASLSQQGKYQQAVQAWEALTASYLDYKDARQQLAQARQQVNRQARLNDLLEEFRKWRQAAEAFLRDSSGLPGIQELKDILAPKQATRLPAIQEPPRVETVTKIPSWIWGALVLVALLSCGLGAGVLGGIVKPATIVATAEVIRPQEVVKTVIVEVEAVQVVKETVVVEAEVVEVVKETVVVEVEAVQPCSECPVCPECPAVEATPVPSGSITTDTAPQVVNQKYIGLGEGVAVSADLRFLATEIDSGINIYDIQQENPVITLKPGEQGKYGAMAFSENGLVLAAAIGSEVRAWNRLDGTLLQTFQGVSNTLFALRFSPDERFLAATDGQGNVYIWRGDTGELLHKFNGHTGIIVGLVFSPDGVFLATGGDDTLIRIWNVANGTWVSDLIGHTGKIHGIAWSPDGQFLASAGYGDTTLRVWQLSKNEIIWLTKTVVNDVAFSPDGTWLVSGGDDGVLKIWNAATGYELAALSGHNSYIQFVYISKDGSQIASYSGSSDNSLGLWGLP